MKASGTCPKCGGTELFHSEWIMDRGDGNQAQPLAIDRTDAIEARDVGQFEVYVCKACGLSEMYVREPAELAELSVL